MGLSVRCTRAGVRAFTALSQQHELRASYAPSAKTMLPCSSFTVRFTSSVASADSTSPKSSTSVNLPPAAVGTVANRDQKRAFLSCFTDIVRDLTEVGFHKELEDANKWYAKVLQYNATGGKLNRGLAVPFTYQVLVPEQERSDAVMRLTYIVGWCVELLQAFFLVVDDIMDGSEYRRGRAAWHKNEGVGLTAINDAVLLEASIYKLLQLHCRQLSCYDQLVELFHKTTLKTALGQSLDVISSKRDGAGLSKFTMDRYKAIVKYKTAQYSFHLPVGLALYLAGIDDKESHRQARSILLEMGHLFQVQDDYLDCFGDPQVMGKVGTDIIDGKCSWLIVVALQRASSSQKQVLQENYGVDDKLAVERVKEVYQCLNLLNVYLKYEQNTYDMICRLIEQTSRGIPQNVFYRLLSKIYQRDK